MILVDTSVWIEHFRQGNAKLVAHLSEGLVLMHPSVSGELACGNLKHRATTLSDLHALPCARKAMDSEVFHLIETNRFWGRGLGWVDIQLLASALLSSCRFWTLDKKLAQAADGLGLG